MRTERNKTEMKTAASLNNNLLLLQQKIIIFPPKCTSALVPLGLTYWRSENVLNLPLFSSQLWFVVSIQILGGKLRKLRLKIKQFLMEGIYF